MKVLLNNNIDRRFIKLLEPHHDVTHVQLIGWDRLKNGELISQAERDGFEALVTADKNLKYQQTLKNRQISIPVLSPLFVDFKGTFPLLPKILSVLSDLPKSSFIKIAPDSD